MDDQNVRIGPHDADRSEILDRIVRRLRHRWNDRDLRRGPHQQGLPVGRRASDRFRRDRTGRAWPILHDEQLAERLAEGLGDQPGNAVGVTAGGKGNDDPHRLLRPNLRPCRLASDNGGDHDERREKHFLRAHDCVPVRSLYLRLRHLSARLDCKARAITGTLRAPRAARKPEERVRAVWRRGQASLAPLLSRQAASRTRADQVR